MTIHNHIQFPPDSTGKKLVHGVLIDLDYTGLISPFSLGETIVGATSGVTASVSKIVSATAQTGKLYLTVIENYANLPATFSISEAILSDSVVKAYVAAYDSAMVQKTVIVSEDNYEQGLNIDNFGSMSVNMSGDAFGRVQVAAPTMLGAYSFEHPQAQEIYKETIGNAVIEHHPEYAGYVLRTSSVSGDSASIKTHQYHKYQPGVSQLINMTVASGDAGKDSVTRRWGYFDVRDGVFFELNGTTFNVVQRSSVTGTIIDTKIPQSMWNKNRLDGTTGQFNITGETFDVSKNNIYWIDVQWLGAGTVRFGTYINGRRIVLHEIHNANKNNVSYMRTGSLPLQWEIINTSATASTSELKAFCSTVMTEGNYNPAQVAFARTHVGIETITSSTVPFIVSSMRMKQSIYGYDNRRFAIPQTFSIWSEYPTVFKIIKNVTLTGTPLWDKDPGPDSGVEFDYNSRTFTGGQCIIARFIPGGFVPIEINLTQQFGLTKERVRRHSNIVDYDTYSFTMTLTDGSTPSKCNISLDWVEVK